MRRLILFGLILNSFFAMAQIPPSDGPDLYGTRHFISLDGTDTLAIYHGTDTTHLISTDSIYIHKLINVSGSGVSDHGSLTGLDDPNDHPWALEWNDTISTIATRTWSTSQFEPKFTKNTAFNKNFGTTAGTVAEGNDSRILKGQTAYSWGDHSVQGYATQTWVGTNYLGITDKAADSDKLDGLSSSQFLRSDESDTMNGNLTVTGIRVGGTYPQIQLGDSDNLIFRTADKFRIRLNGSDKFEFNSDGNLGINKVSPTEKLHVGGNVLVEGIGKFGSDLVTSGTFVSGFAGSGWKLDGSESHLTVDKLTVRQTIETTEYNIYNSSGTLKWSLKADGDDLAFYNANGENKAYLTQDGDLVATGEVTADNINTTVQSLSGTTVTWNVTSGHNATITLSGNTTITMSNLVAGTTGNLTVTNPSTAYTITFSGYTFLISPILGASGDTITMSGNSEKDVLSWYYDGTQVFINGTFSYE